MIQVINNFNKDDCKHFKWVFEAGCCGNRLQQSGACALPLEKDAALSVIPNKPCSTSMRYCKYERKEEA